MVYVRFSWGEIAHRSFFVWWRMSRDHDEIGVEIAYKIARSDAIRWDVTRRDILRKRFEWKLKQVYKL